MSACVKIIQRAVGVSQDGIFGSGTTSAVINYQKKHGLAADGVVGAGTWAKIDDGGGGGGGGGTTVSKSCATPHPTLKSGASSGCIAHAQDQLTKAGFKTTIDGVWGSQTENNIKAFQKKYGRPESGELGKTDWDYLHKAASGKDPVPPKVYKNIHDKAYACTYPRPTVKYQSENGCVKYLQRSLNRAGTGRGALTTSGYYNKTTEDVVKDFQKFYGLTVDGVVASTTWAKIDALATNQEKKDGDNFVNIHAAAYGCTYPHVGVKKGSSGSCVKYLQYSLNKAGLDITELARDGQFGDSTDAALKKFQTKNGLTADGVTSRSTWDKIDALPTNQQQL